MLNRTFALAGALALVFSPLASAQQQDREQQPSSFASSPEPFQQYTQTNLVSNVPGRAAITDPNLANAWGISRNSTGPWWVSDNGTGISTLYDGTGKIAPLVVTIPPSDPNAGSSGTPTGTIFNGTREFVVAAGRPAVFLFSTEDGTISGWNPQVAPTKALILVNEKHKSVFKGLTIGQASLKGGPLVYYLYAADFRKGMVAVYDSKFHHVPGIEQAFSHKRAPNGFAPFNVQNIGGNIYVTYAKQDNDKEDEVDGPGLGFVAVYRPDGSLIQALQPGRWFDAPWGVAIAPSDFGHYSHNVLVGNFGSGQIVAFDAVTGTYKGVLRDATSKPIRIPGLWGISFGNDAGAGPATALYFAAGPDHEQNGLLGTITAIQNVIGNDQ